MLEFVPGGSYSATKKRFPLPPSGALARRFQSAWASQVINGLVVRNDSHGTAVNIEHYEFRTRRPSLSGLIRRYFPNERADSDTR